MRDNSQNPLPGTTRRGLIAGNVKAIAAIGAGALLSRLTPANAQMNGGGNGGGNKHCYLKGTKVRTVEGERRVEELAVGDLLPTVFGGVRPIHEIVRFRREKAEAGKPWPDHARPVRIMKSALAPNVPHADLFVTPGHAVLLDGVLVAAQNLINGTTIATYAADEHDELEFFNIKLETHDAIFAEGAPCETLLRLDEAAADDAAATERRAVAPAEDTYCAPIYGNGAYSEIKWRLHSALSPWIGPHKVDSIRARLQQRAAEVVLGAAGWPAADVRDPFAPGIELVNGEFRLKELTIGHLKFPKTPLLSRFPDAWPPAAGSQGRGSQNA